MTVDFLTGLPYWGILVLVIVNAVIVSRMDIVIESSDSSASDDESKGG